MIRRLLTAAAAIAAVAVPVSSASAATTCAFADSSPCLAKHSRTWYFWGKAPDTSADDSTLSLDVSGFDGLTGKVKKALADNVGDSVDVSLKRGGRYYFVDEHGTKHRVSASDLYGVLDAYPQATVYLTAKLKTDATWDDDTPGFLATVATVDISDLNVLPDLSGDWNLNGSYHVTLTANGSGGYDGTTSDGRATFNIYLSGAKRYCVANYVYTADPTHYSATFTTCGSISADGQKLGAAAWTSPQWGTGTWAFAR